MNYADLNQLQMYKFFFSGITVLVITLFLLFRYLFKSYRKISPDQPKVYSSEVERLLELDAYERISS